MQLIYKMNRHMADLRQFIHLLKKRKKEKVNLRHTFQMANCKPRVQKVVQKETVRPRLHFPTVL